ncbi:MAG: hypothetical protein LBB64_04280 [Dysgonamonadaceae bacterium]|jgi:hypothetical protein|nr:hypothetical protein [Dysgonamonadaceae bacterium]
MKKLMALIGIVVVMSSCNVAKQAAGGYQMTQCYYQFHSISRLNLAGVDLQNVTNPYSLKPAQLTALTAAFLRKEGSLLLTFTLNLDVTNPGQQPAFLTELRYVLEIDGYELTTGYLPKQIYIGSGQTVGMAIPMACDLKQALHNESLEAIKNLAFNFAGIGNGPSRVTVKLQPGFMFKNKTIASPVYFPVSFQLER